MEETFSQIKYVTVFFSLLLLSLFLPLSSLSLSLSIVHLRSALLNVSLQLFSFLSLLISLNLAAVKKGRKLGGKETSLEE